MPLGIVTTTARIIDWPCSEMFLLTVLVGMCVRMVCLHVYVRARAYVHVRVCVRLSECVYMRACARVCVCV